MIFPNLFQIDFENIKVPFLLLIEVKLIRNLFGKCELESCSIKSRSEGLTAYIIISKFCLNYVIALLSR